MTAAILVAAYNAVATLPRCLDSLCAQTLRDIEILCIDDCSTDATLALLRDYARRDPRITVLQTPVNSGHTVARNLALRRVRATYVCMVDADDWLSADALQQAVDVFRSHPRTDCVVFRLMRCFESPPCEQDYGLPAELAHGGALSGPQAFGYCMDNWKLHGLYLIRTDLHRRFPLDESTRLYSDDNTYRLLYLHAREVRACVGIYYYRQHPASQTSTAGFNLHRFDFMEANLSLLFALRREGVPRDLMRRFEGQRWMTFLACYRLYISRQADIPATETAPLRRRFTTILHTFRPSRLPLRYRWKPGYWLLFSPAAFHLQQLAYMRLWEEGLKRRIR